MKLEDCEGGSYCIWINMSCTDICISHRAVCDISLSHHSIYICLSHITFHTDISVSLWYIQSQYIQILLSHHIMYRHFCVTLWYALLFLYNITVSADISVTSWYAWIFLCHVRFSQKPAFKMRHCFYSSNWRMWRGASYQTAGDPAQRTVFAAAGFIPGHYDICPTVPNAGIITSQEPVNACPINCIYATLSAPPALTQQQWVFLRISVELSAHFKLPPLTGANCCP